MIKTKPIPSSSSSPSPFQSTQQAVSVSRVPLTMNLHGTEDKSQTLVAAVEKILEQGDQKVSHKVVSRSTSFWVVNFQGLSGIELSHLERIKAIPDPVVTRVCILFGTNSLSVTFSISPTTEKKKKRERDKSNDVVVVEGTPVARLNKVITYLNDGDPPMQAVARSVKSSVEVSGFSELTLEELQLLFRSSDPDQNLLESPRIVFKSCPGVIVFRLK